MEKHKKILSFLPFVLSVCVGIYLTYLVDSITLNTVFEKIFVLIFFTSSISVLFYLFKKYIGIDFSGKLIVCAILFSLSVIILCGESFFPQKKQTQITFEAVVEDNANHGQEVWLTEVKIDGKIVPISELKIVSNEGWRYISEWDDYAYYPVSNISEENNNELTIEVFCENIEIVFARNAWSGKVSYNLSDFDKNGTLTLYSHADNSIQSGEISFDLSRMNSPGDIIFCSLGAIITSFLFVYALLVIINRNFSKKKKQTPLSQNFIENTLMFSIYLLLVTVLLEIFERAYAYSFENLTLIIGFIILVLIYPYSARILPMFKKFKIAEIVLLFIIVFIVTLQSTAEIIFMKLDKTTINFIDVLTFIIAMAIIAVPILEIALFIDKRAENRFSEGEKNEKE